MPFGTPFDAFYREVLLPALERVGYEVHRADDLGTHQNIVRDIVAELDQAHLVVADLTGRNPNVMYELGLAHALDISTVQITRSIEDIPFDLRAYRAIRYDLDHPDDFASQLVDLAARHLSGCPLWNANN